jgi:hypothetical protein
LRVTGVLRGAGNVNFLRDIVAGHGTALRDWE